MTEKHSTEEYEEINGIKEKILQILAERSQILEKKELDIRFEKERTLSPQVAAMFFSVSEFE